VERFDFESLLVTHPNVISAKEIDLRALPKRVTYRQPQLRVFIATVRVGTLEYELLISEPKGFPKSLPYIHLANPKQHDFHNHVNYKGDVCYSAKDTGVFIDVKQPEAVLHQSLSLAIGTLADSVDRDLTDLQEEFEGYWASLPDYKTVRCFFNPGEEPAGRIKAFCNPKTKNTQIPVAFYQGAIPKDYGYQTKLKRLQSRNAWYVPLEKATLPPPPDSQLIPAYVRGLLKYVAAPNREKLKTELTRQKKRKKTKVQYHNELVLFSQPRPSGMLALFGVAITGCSKSTFFGDVDEKGRWEVTPLIIQRHYEGYVLKRGGAKSSLRDNTVAVIGCGAVGSRVVEQLALSGLGHIIIVDDDELSEDNIYRHVLGGNAIGDYKAEAMAGHLKRRLPYVDIIPKPVKREVWLNEDSWNHVQLIVDATADFTGMRDMNQAMFKSPNPVPVVYCWLEACSIGGHALLVDGKSKGCLECLLDHKEQGPCRRSDFLKPFQNVTKDLTGCGGAFTPFSALDSIKTATLATELALEYLLNDIPNSYRFWIGDDTIAETAGLRTSAWYHMATKEGAKNVETGFIQRGCSVCGGLG
jgi:molybdopterin/thiamine biosynthesis adenylyltransferase